MLPASWAVGDEPNVPRATKKDEAPARTRATGERSVKQKKSEPDAAAQPKATNARTRQVSVGPPLSGSGNAPLTTETLKTWLDDMGFEAKQDGSVFEIEVGGWILFVEVSPNGEYLWMYCGVAKFADASQAPADKLLALMEWSGAYGHFNYSSQYQVVSFQNAIPNTGFSKSFLRKQLENAASVVEGTYPIWNALGWAQ
jgi:hypothetical protein